MFAGGNLDFSYDAVAYAGPAALIDSSKEEGAGGYVFLGSKAGSVNTGADSLITVGDLAPPSQDLGAAIVYPIAIAAFNGVKVGDITSPGGDLLIGSGFETTGSNGNYLFHIRDVNQNDPQGFHRGLGFGGVSTGNINIGLNNEGKASIYVESSNGAARFGSVTGDGREIWLLTSEKVNDLSIAGEVTNMNAGNNSLAPNIFISSRRGLELGGNITNENQAGSGAVVGITCAESDGIVLGAGGITITNNSTGDGGFILVANQSYLDGSSSIVKGGAISYSTGGIVSKADGKGAQIELSADSLLISGTLNAASAGGSDAAGGSLSLEAAGSVNFEGAVISANGKGAGAGGQITIFGETLSAGGATLNANSENGNGGEIFLGGKLSAGKLSINANGGSEGAGGTISIFASELNLQSGDLKATAQGGLAGGRFVAETESNLTVSSKVFNVAPYEGSNGNGGRLWLRSLSGDLTTIGNLNVDGEGAGSGGEMFLSSGGGNFVIGDGGSKLFARSGIEGGDGGRIIISAGKNLAIAEDAVLNAHVRGEQGNGGLIELTGGLLEPGGVTIDSNIQVNGKGTGSGGFIIVNAADFGGAESEGAKIVINGNLTANAGNEATGGGGGGSGGGVGTLAVGTLDVGTLDAGLGAGGSISINLFGDGLNEPGTSYIEINGNLRADGGKNASGGFISIAASGAGNDVTVSSTSLLSAQGGTESGSGGKIELVSATLLLEGTLNASARSSGDGGEVDLVMSAGNGLQRTLYLSGRVLADGSGNASGGLVSISCEDPESALRVVSTAVISAASNSGSAGQILIRTEEQPLTVESAAKLSGKVGMEGSVVTFTSTAANQHLVLGDILASKGDASVSVNGANSSIEVSPGSTLTALGSRADKAGSISLSASKDISISSGASLTVNGASGQSAGEIHLLSGTSGTGIMNIHGSLQANAVGAADGGLIELQYSSSQKMKVSGSINADALGTGASGEVIIQQNADANLNVEISGTISADSQEGIPATTKFVVLNEDRSNVIIDVLPSGKLTGGIEVIANKIELIAKGDGAELLVRSLVSSDSITITLNGNNTRMSLPTEESLIDSGKNIIIRVNHGLLSNSGSIRGSNNTSITVEELQNSGTISAGKALKITSRTLVNDGVIEATGEQGGIELIANTSSLALSGNGVIRIPGSVAGSIQITRSATDADQSSILSVLSNALVFDPGEAGKVIVGKTEGNPDRWTTLTVADTTSLNLARGELQINAENIELGTGAMITAPAVAVNSNRIVGEPGFINATNGALSIQPLLRFMGEDAVVLTIEFDGELWLSSNEHIRIATTLNEPQNNKEVILGVSILGTMNLLSPKNFIKTSHLDIFAQSQIDAPSGLTVSLLGSARLSNNGVINTYNSNLYIVAIPPPDVLHLDSLRVTGSGSITGAGLVANAVGRGVTISQQSISNTIDVQAGRSRNVASRDINIATQSGTLKLGRVITSTGNIEASTGGSQLHLGSSAANPLVSGLISTSNGNISISATGSGALITVGDVAAIKASSTSQSNGTISIVAGQDSQFTPISEAPEGWTFGGRSPSEILVSPAGITGGDPRLISNGGSIRLNGTNGQIHFAGSTQIRTFRPICFEQGQSSLVEHHCEYLEVLSNDFPDIEEIEQGAALLHSGKILVSVKQKYRIETRWGDLELEPGADLELESGRDFLLIRCVKDLHQGSACFVLKDNGRRIPFLVSLGQELRIQSDEMSTPDISNIAQRRTTREGYGNSIVYNSEFSLFDLLSAEDLFVKLRESKDSRHKKLLASIFKSAAAYSLVSASHGGYSK